MAQYPQVSPLQPPAPPPPAPPKKKRGCCSCCLWVLLLALVLAAGFVAFAWFYLQPPTHPVEEEYETIPDYFPAQRSLLNLPSPPPDLASPKSRGEVAHG